MRGRTRGSAAVWTAVLLGILTLTAVVCRLPGVRAWSGGLFGRVFRPGAQATVSVGKLSFTVGDLNAGGWAAADALELHVPDVGQADALLVLQGAHAMLVDAGDPDDADALLQYLARQGVRRLDWLVLTHPHSDHIGGAEAVVRSVAVGNVLLSHAAQTTRLYESLLEAIGERGIPVQLARPDDTFRLGDAECLVLSPDPEKEYDNLNDYSVALRVSYGGFALLLTGDMGTGPEADILASGLPTDAFVLKAGHHGSASASSQAFLDAVAPSVVIVTCEKDSEDRLPNERVMQRFRDCGAAVFRSDENGTVVVRFRDGQVSVGTER